MPAGLAQGFVDFTGQDQQRQLQQAALAAQLLQNLQAQNQQAARGPAFETLARVLGGPAGGGGIPPPPPGTPQGGPMPPQPGANPAPPPQQPQMGAPPGPQARGPMPPQAGPQMPPPPMAGGAPAGGMMRASMPGASPGGGLPAPLPPFKPMPAAVPPQAGGAPGQIGPPPAAVVPDTGMSQPKPMNLQKIVADLKSSGVPPQQAMDVLDQLRPVMNEQNQQELGMFKAQTSAAQAAERFYKDQLTLHLLGQKLDVQRSAETRRTTQGATRLDQGQQKIDNAKRLAEGGDWTPQDVKYWTEVLQQGGDLPPRLATTPGGKKLLSDIMKGTARGDVSPREMMANKAEFMGEKAGQRTLGTRTANIEMASTEAAGLSKLALQASEEWNRTGLKSLNDVEKYAQGKTASPTLRRFVAANTSFINAYARAINPQGVGTVADKEHAREMLEVGFAKGDYAAAIEQLQQEIKVAQSSPGQVKESMRERFVGGGARKSAPDEALSYLKAHPETAPQFSAKYGYLPAGAR